MFKYKSLLCKGLGIGLSPYSISFRKFSLDVSMSLRRISDDLSSIIVSPV